MNEDQTAKMFGARLRELRKSRKLTMDELAERAGISSKYLGEVERGQTNVTLGIAGKAAKALDYELSELFEFGHKKPAEELRAELHEFIDSCGNNKLEKIYFIIMSTSI